MPTFSLPALVDIFLYLTLAQLLVLLGLFFIQTRKTVQGKIALFFCTCVIGFLVMHLDKLDQYRVNYLFMALDYALPVSFYLFCKTLFDDHFQLKKWMIAALIGVVFLSFIMHFRLLQLTPLNNDLESILYHLVPFLHF